jgi:cytochrome c biogenesis protein CcdA
LRKLGGINAAKKATLKKVRWDIFQHPVAVAFGAIALFVVLTIGACEARSAGEVRWRI